MENSWQDGIAPPEAVVEFAKQILGRVADGKCDQALAELDKNCNVQGLQRQETVFQAFDGALRSLTFPEQKQCSLFGPAAEVALREHAKFCDDRLTKALFRRITDHTQMCIRGCGLHAIDLGPIARNIVHCYPN